MTIVISLIGLCLILPALLMRLIVLAPTRIGAFFYYTNVLSDFFPKRLGFRRGLVEIALFILGLILWVVFGLPYQISLTALAVLAGLELFNRISERKILDSIYVHLDTRSHKGPWHRKEITTVGAIPSPSPHPEIVVNFLGPFTRRFPEYNLGDIMLGRAIDVEIILGNHSLIPCQIPISVKVDYPKNLKVEKFFPEEIPPLLSGEVYRAKMQLYAVSKGGQGRISISVDYGGRKESFLIVYESILTAENAQIIRAAINRYPGACQAAFAWRGDMDLYDTSSFQSIDGLTRTLGLAARYRFPQTMYLSARLSLVLSEAEEFGEHFKVNRGHEQIPAFVSWLKENVEMRHQIPYPFQFDKPYAIELGNHMYLHYGTHAAAAPGNNWKLGAKMNEGKYDWLGSERTSFAEQRDNAMAAQKIYEELFQFTPRSAAIPDTTFDEYTAAAFEAAGCKVVSDSNASHLQNIVLQPPPHHPRDTGVVELTKRYPGDPESILQLAMIRYWMHRAHRRRIPVIFMCHQHMRQFSGHACTAFTEYILNYVLTRFNGDLHINTVYGIGIYWNEVFSPQNRTIAVENEADKVIVRNNGEVDFSNVPVDINYQEGRRCTVLCDLPPNSSFEIGVDGKIERL